MNNYLSIANNIITGSLRPWSNENQDEEKFRHLLNYKLRLNKDNPPAFCKEVISAFNDLKVNTENENIEELKSNLEIEFILSDEQQKAFNQKFSHWQNFYEKLLGSEYNATVRRLGLITFRTAMIFTVLRIMETGELSRPLICSEIDFNNALSITEVLIKHAKKVYSGLPVSVNLPTRENRKQRFYSQLPDTFSRQDYLKVANKLKIPDKTAQGYIAKFKEKGLIHSDKKDCYLKMHIEETKDFKEAKDG